MRVYEERELTVFKEDGIQYSKEEPFRFQIHIQVVIRIQMYVFTLNEARATIRNDRFEHCRVGEMRNLGNIRSPYSVVASIFAGKEFSGAGRGENINVPSVNAPQ